MTTANARRQKRFRSRQAAEARQIRTLLSDAYRTLHEHVTYNHTVPANRYGPEQDITVCHLCGGCDEHTPECLMYRADRVLEEDQPGSAQQLAGLKAAETKGPEERRRAALMAVWTKKHGKNDRLNPYSPENRP